MNVSRKYRVPIIVLLFVLLIIGLTVYISRKDKQAPFYAQKIVDQCTGTVGTITPNQGPEKYNMSGSVFLSGSQPILDNGATQAQYQKVQETIAQYSKTKLNNRYQNIAIVPGTFKANAGVMTAKLCLGQRSNTVDMTIKLSQLIYVELIIDDPSGKNGGNYDSGQLTINPQFYSNSYESE
jgi:hypothetical protein